MKYWGIRKFYGGGMVKNSSEHFIRNLVGSMKERCRLVIENNGERSPY
jgi:hypothetical protein